MPPRSNLSSAANMALIKHFLNDLKAVVLLIDYLSINYICFCSLEALTDPYALIIFSPLDE